MASKALALTDEQSSAVEALLKFIADPEGQFFTLSGFAGTGKTFCMREVVSRCAKSHARIAFTAPTNKAAKVLRAVTGKASTIYSLLGLRIEKNGELKELVTGKGGEVLTDLDVIFIDEASMVNARLFQELLNQCTLSGVKVVFMGDSAQLPPVKEITSPVWGIDRGATLTRVMRHDNQILKLVTEIRLAMNSFAPSITIKSNNDQDEGVWKLTQREFKNAITKAAMAGVFGDSSNGKVIAWRNLRVDEYNNLIRYAIYGAAAVPGHFIIGDRVIATGPCQLGDDIILATDEEAIVEGIIECLHPQRKEYRAIELKCRTETNKIIRLMVLHPDSQEKFNNDCEELAHAARLNGKMWKSFWLLKELFHEIKYGYAITAHRAQGSTYTTAFVDYTDILYNRNRKEAFQCLYVACSRPTTRLILGG